MPTVCGQMTVNRRPARRRDFNPNWIASLSELLFGAQSARLNGGVIAMQTCRPNQRVLCLDMFQVSWLSGRTESSDSAILVEIGDLGGLLQTNVEIPPGKRLTMTLPNGRIKATVSSCKKDDFGYLAEILVDADTDWFCGSYRPPYLKEETIRPRVTSPRKHAAVVRRRRKAVALGTVSVA